MEEGRQRQAAVKKPQGARTRQKAVGRGRAEMNAAADQTLELNSKKIAKLLLQKTLDGNLTSAKLLFALAEGRIDCEDVVVVKQLISVAEKLAAEPQCSEEMIDAQAVDGSEEQCRVG